MNDRSFGRRLSGTAELTVPGGPYLRRSRLFAQVAAAQYGCVSFLLSMALVYLAPSHQGVGLGLLIIGVHLAMCAIILRLNRNVLVIDEKLRHAARSAQSGFWQFLALTLMWLFAGVFALIVIGSDEELDCISVFSLIMSIVVLVILTRRALRLWHRLDGSVHSPDCER